MRGPYDDAIEAKQGPAAGVDPPDLEKAAAQRPPGGKQLIRLLELLERSGYTRAAEVAVEAAVGEQANDIFRDRISTFTAAPSGKPSLGAASRGSSKRRSAAKAPESLVDDEVAEAYMEVAAPPTGPPSGSGPYWESIGPWTTPNGQTYGASRVNVSGRIAAIAVDPSNPAHVLVGAANGGVWESFDRGGSWAPRTDYARTLAVGAIAFDRSNPAIVYCGTGEGNWWAWLGAGILRSTNGGTTWTQHCTAPFVGQGFYDLIVDPADGRHLLAATTGGLYVSTDGGVTWTRRRTARTWSIAMSPAGGPSAEILCASSDGVFRSTNGGTSWTAVSIAGLPAAFDRLAVAIARSNPGVAYVWGARGATAYLRRRSGGTWSTVPLPPGVSTGQAWYDWYLGVSPDRAGQIYVGAIESHRGDRNALLGTWTWRNLSNKGATGDSIHPDQHAIAFEPGAPSTIYIGNDGGLYRSANRGINWTHCNNGLVITEFEFLAQSFGNSRWVIGGTQDNGTARWTGSSIWEHVADGDGGDCGVNRTNPSTVFHTYYGMSPERSTTGGGWASWTWIGPPLAPGEGSLFYPPFEASATNGDTCAIGGDRVYVSRNNGSAWTALAFPSAARSSAMYIPNADNVFVGASDGRIFRTRWTGFFWTALTQLAGTPRAGAFVSDLFVDPNNLNRIWATSTTVGGGRVFRSDDGGANWTNCSNPSLPTLPITAIEVDPWNANRVWVAADKGVYQTLDGGASWADYANALPNCYVGDLAFHPHARVLRAATRNRGVWQIPVDGWMTQPVCGVQWTGSLAGNASGRWFTWGWPATWHMVWTIMPTSPRPGGPQVGWNVQVERAGAEHATYWITVMNRTPDPVTFEGRYCILSRY
jgi:hypothetical protein